MAHTCSWEMPEDAAVSAAPSCFACTENAPSLFCAANCICSDCTIKELPPADQQPPLRAQNSPATRHCNVHPGHVAASLAFTSTTISNVDAERAISSCFEPVSTPNSALPFLNIGPQTGDYLWSLTASSHSLDFEWPEPYLSRCAATQERPTAKHAKQTNILVRAKPLGELCSRAAVFNNGPFSPVSSNGSITKRQTTGIMGDLISMEQQLALHTRQQLQVLGYETVDNSISAERGNIRNMRDKGHI